MKMASAKKQGQDIVRFFPLGDDYGLLPGVVVSWDHDPASGEVGIRFALRVIKHSPIAGASKMADVTLARPVGISIPELKAAFDKLVAEPQEASRET